ncbi:hypothetical protein BT69DRAFT_1338346 [Atractiella rhizophila]|nr:hypothetical protein BT69DRAFT_1338346 [Atractiella rhizophila]
MQIFKKSDQDKAKKEQEKRQYEAREARRAEAERKFGKRAQIRISPALENAMNRPDSSYMDAGRLDTPTTAASEWGKLPGVPNANATGIKEQRFTGNMDAAMKKYREETQRKVRSKTNGSPGPRLELATPGVLLFPQKEDIKRIHLPPETPVAPSSQQLQRDHKLFGLLKSSKSSSNLAPPPPIPFPPALPDSDGEVGKTKRSLWSGSREREKKSVEKSYWYSQDYDVSSDNEIKPIKSNYPIPRDFEAMTPGTTLLSYQERKKEDRHLPKPGSYQFKSAFDLPLDDGPVMQRPIAKSFNAACPPFLPNSSPPLNSAMATTRLSPIPAHERTTSTTSFTSSIHSTPVPPSHGLSPLLTHVRSASANPFSPPTTSAPPPAPTTRLSPLTTHSRSPSGSPADLRQTASATTIPRERHLKSAIDQDYPTRDRYSVAKKIISHQRSFSEPVDAPMPQLGKPFTQSAPPRPPRNSRRNQALEYGSPPLDTPPASSDSSCYSPTSAVFPPTPKDSPRLDIESLEVSAPPPAAPRANPAISLPGKKQPLKRGGQVGLVCRREMRSVAVEGGEEKAEKEPDVPPYLSAVPSSPTRPHLFEQGDDPFEAIAPRRGIPVPRIDTDILDQYTKDDSFLNLLPDYDVDDTVIPEMDASMRPSSVVTIATDSPVDPVVLPFRRKSSKASHRTLRRTSSYNVLATIPPAKTTRKGSNGTVMTINGAPLVMARSASTRTNDSDVKSRYPSTVSNWSSYTQMNAPPPVPSIERWDHPYSYHSLQHRGSLRW